MKHGRGEGRYRGKWTMWCLAPWSRTSDLYPKMSCWLTKSHCKLPRYHLCHMYPHTPSNPIYTALHWFRNGDRAGPSFVALQQASQRLYCGTMFTTTLWNYLSAQLQMPMPRLLTSTPASNRDRITQQEAKKETQIGSHS